MNFEKFLRTPSLQNTSGLMLLTGCRIPSGRQSVKRLQRQVTSVASDVPGNENSQFNFVAWGEYNKFMTSQFIGEGIEKFQIIQKYNIIP